MPSINAKPSAQSVSHNDMANAIRALSMDAVQAADSGHPGMPMGMADVATVLFTKFLKFDPHQPSWPDRDRFILSAGHGSMLLYSLLYLTGYEDFPLEEIRRFRQLGAKTAGHPEYGHGAGIETTTGPLGQGLGAAVGMAIAEAHLAARFGHDVVNHKTYTIAGDGCLMEGISQESISLAGHLRLKNLVVLWDDNGISIDGPISLTSSEDQLMRFKAAGWATRAIDGHDPRQIEEALAWAQGSELPVMIACKTTIAYGSPNKCGSAASHGAPLGHDEIALCRTQLNWPHDPFVVPDNVLHAWREAGYRGRSEYENWTHRVEQLRAPQREEYERRLRNELPDGWQGALNDFIAEQVKTKAVEATRKSSQRVLEVLTKAVPELLGGSADLTGSNLTKTGETDVLDAGNYGGRYLHYGIREHAMAAAMNGIVLHGGVIPYGATFLVFADYCRPSIRLSALMGVQAIYVMTHDSIGLGEDGPTHQPVEHLASLRAIPNLLVFRPADTVETAECWALALQNRNRPSLLSLTRQNVQPVRTEAAKDNRCAKGGYILSPSKGEAKAVLIATGSEVGIAMQAQRELESRGIPARVVSMPSWELFEEQPESYREQVLGEESVLRVAIEAAGSFGWERYIGRKGVFIGMPGFGASGPAKDLYKHFGITSEAVVQAVSKKLAA